MKCYGIHDIVSVIKCENVTNSYSKCVSKVHMD